MGCHVFNCAEGFTGLSNVLKNIVVGQIRRMSVAHAVRDGYAEVGCSIGIPVKWLRAGCAIGVTEWLALNLFVVARVIDEDVSFTVGTGGETIVTRPILAVGGIARKDGFG